MSTSDSAVATGYASPVGRLTIVARDEGLSAIWFEDHRGRPAGLDALPDGSLHPVVAGTVAGLDDYFETGVWVGGVPLAARGTPFQHEVWDALTAIPAGHTRTYGELAASIGRPTSVRAAAAAVGANPLSIIVPCHRVVGRDKMLTGYAGGLQRKRWLLDFEALALARH